MVRRVAKLVHVLLGVNALPDPATDTVQVCEVIPFTLWRRRSLYGKLSGNQRQELKALLRGERSDMLIVDSCRDTGAHQILQVRTAAV